MLKYLLPLCGRKELLARTASGWSPLTTACRSKQSPCVVAVLERARELRLHESPEVAKVSLGLVAGAPKQRVAWMGALTIGLKAMY